MSTTTPVSKKVASSSRQTHSPVEQKTPLASGSTARMPMQTSLERKLELLEARFTMPAPVYPKSPSEATLGPLSSPNASAHSFGFGTPSFSNLSAASRQHSQPLPSGSVRSKRQQSWNNNLLQVSRAAEKHMRKVAASSPTQLDESRLSLTAATESNQTLITGHLRPKTARVVQESPPVQTPSKTSSAVVAVQGLNKESSAKKLASAAGAQPASSAAKDKKRKSVPTRRQVPSVKENLGNDPQPPKQQPAAAADGRTRKRTRLPFTDKKLAVGSPFVAALDSEAAAASKATATAVAVTAKPVPRKATNMSLYSFFDVKSTKRATSPSYKKSHAASSSNPTTPPRPAPVTAVTMAARSTQSPNYQTKCTELERLLQDKNEQLAAVSNNRTIVHTALQQALQKRQDELTAVKSELQQQNTASRGVMEELVRHDATAQAVAVRERLAVDGARLGRIVYARAGLRSVETWEDGQASKQLAKRQAGVVEKRQALERRHAAAKKAAKAVQEQKEKPAATDEDADLIGGIQVRTPLEATEAVESVRFHLSNVKRLEKELAVEEQTLNDEKCAHIRALKRVASEDSSRFRSRPKLHDRYVLRALLGKGGFSEVWKAYDLVELREVAVKIHQLDPRWPDAKKENYTKHVSREYEIHRNVRHPRIVSLFDVFEIDNNSFATVLELCNGTDLDAVLKEKKRLPERDARAILLQILLGMQYLSHPSTDGSRQGIIHYDLKPGNILFDEFGDAKITDFGLSKIVDTPDPAESMELTSQGAGTYWYLPPECFVVTENVRISNKVDVWSIGVIFFQVLYGKRPFGDGQSQDKLLRDHTMLNAHEVKFPDKPNVSDEGKQFIKACLTYDQAFRPTIAQICQHSYILNKQF